MLLGKEIKKTVVSITFFVFIIALLVMPFSQDVLNFSNDILTVPEQGEDYGIQQKEVPELIMPAAFSSLYKEFTVNEYIALKRQVKMPEKWRWHLGLVLQQSEHLY